MSIYNTLPAYETNFRSAILKHLEKWVQKGDSKLEYPIDILRELIQDSMSLEELRKNLETAKLMDTFQQEPAKTLIKDVLLFVPDQNKFL